MHFSKPPLGTPLDWGNPLNDETVLALAMNEGHGDKVQDLSMNGNHGTLNNFAFPPTVDSGWNPGQTGVGVITDGTNDHINCGNKCFDFSGEMTLSALVSIHSFVHGGSFEGGSIFTKGVGVPRIEIGIDWSGMYFYTVDAGGSSTVHYQMTAQNLNELYCVTGTREPDGYMAIYLNGVSMDEGAKTLRNVVNAIDLKIGDGTGVNSLDGFIDQPRIQSRAWTAKEVKDYAINPWQVYLDE